MGFVHSIQKRLRFAFVGRAERSLFFRAVLLPVKVAVTAAIQSIFLLHVFLHVEENERTEFFPLESIRGVVAEFVRIVHSPVDLLANPLAFLGFPVLPAGETAALEQFKFGSSGRIRTYDQSVNSRPLYH